MVWARKRRRYLEFIGGVVNIMKIPKKILKLLDKREKLAMELISATAEMDRWLIDKGADLTDDDLKDSVLSGCMIYCEPGSAKLNVKKYIENKM